MSQPLWLYLIRTAEEVIDGARRYFMSAVDAKFKFALTLKYKNITAAIRI